MSTCNWLDLQTPGSRPIIMPKNLPDHCQAGWSPGLSPLYQSRSVVCVLWDVETRRSHTLREQTRRWSAGHGHGISNSVTKSHNPDVLRQDFLSI